MKRWRGVAVCVLVLLAGCGAIGSSGPDATNSSTTPPTDGCPPEQNYERKPLPEQPSTFTENSVAEFAATYEETVVWNDLRGRAETALSSNGRAEVVNRTETGYVVHVTGGASYQTCTNGRTAVADIFFHTNYFVNETTVVRLELPQNKSTNPRTNNGTVVETWGS